MPKSHAPQADRIAGLLRRSQEKIATSLDADSPTQHVMAGFSEAYRAWLESVSAKPQTLLDLQGKYMQEQMSLWMKAFQPEAPKEAPRGADKRFSAPEWDDLPLFRYYRDSYLLTSKMMMQAVDEAELGAADKRRMRFFMRQYLDAAAPSNYLATNPEAIKAALESGGKSIEDGMKNLVADMEKGRISMTDEQAFEVGRNIALSKGAVVHENELIQLIQYSPLTAKVHERPLVMVPPCINKFYIMDLQPENSLVRYAVEQGHTVFMVSWRNVKPPLDKLTWDDYVEMGVIAALDEAKAITGADKVNALGFCIGGTLLSAVVLFVLAIGAVKGFAFTLGLTTLIDIAIVFWFTKPFVTLLGKTKFFGEGHRFSGFEAEHLGAANPPLHNGRQRPATTGGVA